MINFTGQKQFTSITPNQVFEIYVKNLSFKAHENDIGNTFQAFGPVEQIKILKDESGRSKGGAFVKFETEEGMENALKEGRTEICGRAVTIERSNGKVPDKQDRQERPPVEITDQTLTIFVGSLALETDENSLRNFFSSCGEVKDIKLKKNEDGTSKGYGFINFSCKEDIQKAFLKNQTELDGKQIKVNVVAPRPEGEPKARAARKLSTEEGAEEVKADQSIPSDVFQIYIKSLHFKADENDILNCLSTYGEVEQVKILKDENGRSKGGALVKFESEEGVLRALKEGNNCLIRGRAVSLERSKGKPQGVRVQLEITDQTLTIFVGNLSFKTDENSLRNYFSSCGEVLGARVQKNEEGNSKGFAYVNFSCKEDVQKAVQKHSSSLDGRTIRVNVATPRTGGGGDRAPRGGERGGSDRITGDRDRSDRGGGDRIRGDRDRSDRGGSRDRSDRGGSRDGGSDDERY